jgi:hypothetical protein
MQTSSLERHNNNTKNVVFMKAFLYLAGSSQQGEQTLL